jgi:uncharacterized membrane protein YfcA
VSFPTLVALGVPAVAANATNTVALCPGYLAGSWAQREQLKPQLAHARSLAAAGALGGLTGSIALVYTPESAFRAAVPFLVLLACAMMLAQEPLRRRIVARRPAVVPESPAAAHPSPALVAAVFAGAVYGGFFGAGLGIMLLAMLGLFSDAPLVHLNALKQALSLVINTIAAVFLSLSGHVEWPYVFAMMLAAWAGGHIGGRLVQRVPARVLRAVVITFGVLVALRFWWG